MHQRPKCGDRATKNGVLVVVRLVENNEVFGERWSATAKQTDNPAKFRKLWPFTRNVPGYLGEFRIAMVDWLLAIHDARYERVA